MCLEAKLANYILHVALSNKMDRSDSRAVIQCVQCPHIARSFRVTHVCMHSRPYCEGAAKRV